MSWPIERLGDVCEVNPRLPKGTDETQKVSFVQMSSVSEQGQLLFQEEKVLAETKKGFTYFNRGDVLLAKITPCFENGKAVLTGALEYSIGFGSTEFHVLRAKENVADAQYIFYLVWNDMFRFYGQHAMKGAAGQKRVSADFLKSLKIPLPPLAEQKKIAAILDAADQLRQKDQQLIDHYTSLSQSLFLEMFGDPVTNPMGWDIKPFEYFAAIDTKMTKNFERYADVPHVGVANIEKETGNLIGYKLVREESLSSGKYVFTSDHILYSKIRPILNKVAMPGFSGLASADSYPLLVNRVVTNKFYFTFILRSDAFLDFISKHSKRTNIPKANKAQLKQFKTISPPVELQNEFAKYVQIIEQQKQQSIDSLGKSEALFNSLLQQAFKGELTCTKAA